jgi:hypothetical protein
LKKRARVNINRRSIRRKMKKVGVTLEIIGQGILGWGLKEIFSPRECGALQKHENKESQPIIRDNNRIGRSCILRVVLYP